MRKENIFILFISVIFWGQAQNQDLKFGLGGGTHVAQFTRYSEPEYQPANADFTYQEKTEGAGVINQTHIFNAFSVGTYASFTRKKSTLTAELQYFMQRSVFPFEKEQYSERLVGMKAFRLPMMYSWRLFKKKNSMFISLGTMMTVAKNYDSQFAGREFLMANGEIYNGGEDFGDNHFESILYSNQLYWQNFFEIGKNIGDFKLSFRFIRRSKGSRQLIEADINQVEIYLKYHIFAVSDFTKKRSIYHE